MAEQKKPQHLYKVLVIGDYAVGKTSIIKRYCEGYFTPNYKLTIGVDFAVKDILYKDIESGEEKNVTLQLWDVAGHERFGTMTRVYYKYAIAGFVVYDISRHATFEAVTKWRDDVNSKVVLANDEPIPLVLLANKCDLSDVKVDRNELDQFIKENGFVAWFETSAMNNTNIDDAMHCIVSKILAVAASNKPQMPIGTVLITPDKKEDSAFAELKECCQ